MVHDMNILNALVKLRDDIKIWVTNNLNALNAKIDEKTIPIDSELSLTSTNPVQNKAIKNAIDDLRTELSESIVSENNEWKVVDGNGNIIFSVDEMGAHTTNLTVDGENINSKFAEYALVSTITTLEQRIDQLEAQLAGVESQLSEI